MHENSLRVPFFYGTHSLIIDSKNRLLVPSEIRKRIDPELDGEALFVTLRGDANKGRVLWLYPEKYYEQLLMSLMPPDITPNDDLIEYTQMAFALAERVEWDSQGRIGLPASLLKDAGLGNEVSLIGMRDHLELWSRDRWESRRGHVLEEGRNIEIKGKAALKELRKGDS
jgi:MraZ protein